MAEPEGFLLKPDTARKLVALLARPDGFGPSTLGGMESTGPAGALLKVGALIGTTPRPHYRATVRAARGLTESASGGAEVVLAGLDATTTYAAGQLVVGFHTGEYNGKPLFWPGGVGGGIAGFYAKLTAGANPYSFVEVSGPSAAASTVTGGRTGSLNAYEQVGPHGSIPSGKIVWMYVGTGAGLEPYRFNAVKVSYVSQWQVNSGATCTLTPLAYGYEYVSGPNACGGVA